MTLLTDWGSQPDYLDEKWAWVIQTVPTDPSKCRIRNCTGDTFLAMVFDSYDTVTAGCHTNKEDDGTFWSLEPIALSPVYTAYKIRQCYTSTLLQGTNYSVNSLGDRGVTLVEEDTVSPEDANSCLWSLYFRGQGA